MPRGSQGSQVCLGESWRPGAHSGDWTYYVSPEGSGYVKVLTGSASQPYDYMEHLTSELKTVTYWGKRSG
jgi:hypothetical protein